MSNLCLGISYIQSKITKLKDNTIHSDLIYLYQGKSTGVREKAPDLLHCKLYQNKAQNMF